MSYGSRKRYLAEQEAFMADRLGYTVSKARGRSPYTGSASSPLDPMWEPPPPKPRPEAPKQIGSGAKGVRLGTRGKLGLAGAAVAAPVIGGSLMSRRRIEKSEPLKTHMKESDAKRVVGRYGLAGELPKHLTREQRMGAYEARYISAGGRKGERWQRRAERSDKIKTVGLAGATVGGAAVLASRAKPIAARLGNRAGKVQHRSDSVAIGAATVGGAAELDAARARRKRASYSSAPGGAAASALRRMRAMDAARSQR